MSVLKGTWSKGELIVCHVNVKCTSFYYILQTPMEAYLRGHLFMYIFLFQECACKCP